MNDMSGAIRALIPHIAKLTQRRRLRWLKDRPRDHEPDHELWFGDECVATVYPRYQGATRIIGYVWYAECPNFGIARENPTEPVATVEEAKTQCRAYVEGCLREAGYRR